MTQRPSIAARTHGIVKDVAAGYVRIEKTCNAILDIQKKSRLSPVWISLMVLGAFVAGGLIF